MMTLQQATEIVGGEMHGDNVSFAAVSTDSRKLKSGDLYIALQGERFDGHDFVQQAQDAGAVAALVQADITISLPYIKVDNTRHALGRLAAARRQSFAGPLVAITGSNGKTTVKEMLAAILRKQGEVLMTQGNFNNDIGMPLTLLNLQQQDYAVIEMGANHRGEIAYLTEIAKPDIALVNNAGPAHLEGFGSIQGVAEAKAEIYQGLPEEGVAIINRDDDYSGYWHSLCEKYRIVDFSLRDKTATVYGEWKPAEQGGMLKVWHNDTSFRVALKVYGLHNAMNALAAISVAVTLQVPVEKISEALQQFEPVEGRLKLHQVSPTLVVIDDTYNANPASLSAGIDVLKQLPGEHWLILGDMGELGGDATRLHFDAGIKARRAGISRLLAVGEASQHAVDAFGEGAQLFENKDELMRFIKLHQAAALGVLVKGSRFMHMEEIVKQLTEEIN
jgi:UDP-N-acetylmuramoyl-tripeptide--D-alanyl-D-alanine ligase